MFQMAKRKTMQIDRVVIGHTKRTEQKRRVIIEEKLEEVSARPEHSSRESLNALQRRWGLKIGFQVRSVSEKEPQRVNANILPGSKEHVLNRGHLRHLLRFVSLSVTPRVPTCTVRDDTSRL